MKKSAIQGQHQYAKSISGLSKTAPQMLFLHTVHMDFGVQRTANRQTAHSVVSRCLMHLRDLCFPESVLRHRTLKPGFRISPSDSATSAAASRILP